MSSRPESSTREVPRDAANQASIEAANDPLVRSAASPLTLAGLAGLLASTCCVAPLLFAIVGISGSWIGQLRRLEPYSGVFTGLAAVSLAYAAWRIYGPAGTRARVLVRDCVAPAACAVAGKASRRWFWLLVAFAVLPIVVQRTAHLFY